MPHSLLATQLLVIPTLTSMRNTSIMKSLHMSPFQNLNPFSSPNSKFLSDTLISHLWYCSSLLILLVSVQIPSPSEFLKIFSILTFISSINTSYRDYYNCFPHSFHTSFLSSLIVYNNYYQRLEFCHYHAPKSLDALLYLKSKCLGLVHETICSLALVDDSS